ncbi:hypothetical protein [Bradyrhizobium genosp. A]|uniref:hypothetical protein n=1 Tax=Bradyrhizobium genosp. A TaxID=83626 RepID=UPI003CEB168D
MVDGSKARRMRRLPSAGFSGDLREEPLAGRLRRIAQEQAKKAIEEIKEQEIKQGESKPKRKK